jgi:hypothetical protein
MDIKTVEHEVKPILEEYENTRADDMRLYVRYITRKGGDVGKVFFDRKYRLMNGLASYETVSRVRRKLQERDAGLRPSKEYIEARKKAEQEYRAYAKGKGGATNE